MSVLQLTCPECGELTTVRRSWCAFVTANVLIDSAGGFAYPDQGEDMDIDETAYDDDEHSEYYCAACGGVIAKDTKELLEKIEEENNGA